MSRGAVGRSRAALARSLHLKMIRAQLRGAGLHQWQWDALRHLAEASAGGSADPECPSCGHSIDLDRFDPAVRDLLARFAALLRSLTSPAARDTNDVFAEVLHLLLHLAQDAAVLDLSPGRPPEPVAGARRAVASLTIAPTAPPVPVLSAA